MIEEALQQNGYSPAEIDELKEMMEAEMTERTLPLAAEIIHRIFVRVDCDSVAGRALARALGFTNSESLNRAARDFGVTKQYLHKLETELKAKLADVAHQKSPAPKSTGPSAQ